MITSIQKKIIVSILESEGISQAKLFGSFSRGSQTSSSDIDIVIEIPRSDFSFFDLSRVERTLESALGRKVDLVTYKSLHKKILPIVKKEEVDLF